MQASKSLFEGLTAKLTRYLGPHDTHDPQLRESRDGSNPSNGKGKAANNSHYADRRLLGMLSLDGKVKVQPGGYVPCIVFAVTAQLPVVLDVAYNLSCMPLRHHYAVHTAASHQEHIRSAGKPTYPCNGMSGRSW